MKCGVLVDSICTSPPSWAPISFRNVSRSHDVAEPSVTVSTGYRAMSAIASTSPLTASSSHFANHCMTSSYAIPYIVRNLAPPDHRRGVLAGHELGVEPCGGEGGERG